MGFKNILVPYDNSEHANNALKEAINMASENPEAKIHVVEVVLRRKTWSTATSTKPVLAWAFRS